MIRLFQIKKLSITKFHYISRPTTFILVVFPSKVVWKIQILKFKHSFAWQDDFKTKLCQLQKSSLPSVKKTLGKEALCRVWKKTLVKKLFAEYQKYDTRQRNSLPSVQNKTLGKELLCRVFSFTEGFLCDTRQILFLPSAKKKLSAKHSAKYLALFFQKNIWHSSKSRIPGVIPSEIWVYKIVENYLWEIFTPSPVALKLACSERDPARLVFGKKKSYKIWSRDKSK
jgi:hypothetical protein